MIAIFREQDTKRLIGYKEDVTQEEADTFEIDFILTDTLPSELRTIPEWHYAVVEDDLSVSYQLMDGAPEPQDPQEAKIKELNTACNSTILAGFTSDALGTDNTYDFDYDAQINFSGMLNAITAGIVTTDITWKASGTPTSHTIEQFKTVFADGLQHKNTQIEKYWTLKAQVLAATTPEEIAAIVW